MIKRASVKENGDKLHFIKIKNLSFSSDTMRMLNKQAIEFETTFAQVYLKKNLKSIYVNIKQTSNLIKTCKRLE